MAKVVLRRHALKSQKENNDSSESLGKQQEQTRPQISRKEINIRAEINKM